MVSSARVAEQCGKTMETVKTLLDWRKVKFLDYDRAVG
jgi:hypothetical protein